MEECNNATLSDLDAAADLFRDALDRRPAPHPLRGFSLRDLADALLTRFSLTGLLQDLDKAMTLLAEQVIGWKSQLDVRNHPF
jgi:hypothetical protein